MRAIILKLACVSCLCFLYLFVIHFIYLLKMITFKIKTYEIVLNL